MLKPTVKAEEFEKYGFKKCKGDYSCSRNEEILKAILRIIQIVANYSEEAFEEAEK